MNFAMEGFNWNAINTGVVILSFLISGVGLYLRMFIAGKMSTLETTIMAKIESKFSLKEIVALEIREHDRRLTQIETKMESIRLFKEHDEARASRK